MNCPLCLVELNMSDRHGVEIDFCPKCRGVWLDRGELDKVIERAVAEQTSSAELGNRGIDEPRTRAEVENNRNRHHGRTGKKKSFLGDLFDFD